jgi:hypothetical protein
MNVRTAWIGTMKDQEHDLVDALRDRKEIVGKAGDEI